MSQLDTAFERFMEALEGLQRHVQETKSQQTAMADAQIEAYKTEIDSLNNDCAHLRAEVSALKKQVQQQNALHQKAEQQVEAILDDIQNALEGANG
ncbi:MAG: hypothetical protein ACON41_03750 [Parvibaculales bacterium]